ncbi:putative transferase CAF17, mitochondrial [Varroa jacobsoni]|uniref:putative transferase CAF17, mitochondrial n=1 Tax=Varroa jacobsoni TaxID=62625 RepID=UPI000BF831F8|nr:putative transferase CAF17, mitochondrial [Varroa jacobsoni]XP_022710087.1 putative transferase CAF17, mitochondrial [Varroa jacobsoni]
MYFEGISVLAKSLVRLRGTGTLPLLNALLTNEINTTNPVIYSYLLNSQGRVLFDLFLYKLNDNDVLLEVDRSAEQSLIKVLNFYKLRRPVDIASSSLVACVASDAQSAAVVQDIDPRLPQLGHKVVLEKSPANAKAADVYCELRYRLGVPEGISELGLGKAIPLESNGDYLKAISFEKGCYIGQELTARAYHTGIVRKRFMPLKFSEVLQGFKPGSDASVLNEKDSKVGVLKAAQGIRGLGLMRIKESLEAEMLKTDKYANVQLTIAIPTWWPKNR